MNKTSLKKEENTILIHKNFDKCVWFKNEIEEIHTFFNEIFNIDKNILIHIPDSNTILLQITAIVPISIDKIHDLEIKYKELKNYYIESNSLVLKFERGEINKEESNEENKIENDKITFIEETSKIDINHKWLNKRNSHLQLEKYEKSNMSKIINKVAFVLRKLNIKKNDTSIDINLYKSYEHTESIDITLNNLTNNIQLKDFYEDLKIFATEPIRLKDIIINTNANSISISISSIEKIKNNEEQSNENNKKMKWWPF